MNKPDELIRMAELIKKAILDGVITTSEYDEILAAADADGVLDRQEKKLLNQLQEMLANRTIRRIK